MDHKNDSMCHLCLPGDPKSASPVIGRMYVIQGKLKSGRPLYFQGYTDVEDGILKESFVLDPTDAFLFRYEGEAYLLLSSLKLHDDLFEVVEHPFV